MVAAADPSSPSGTHLSSLALETANALLSPLISHLRTACWLAVCSSKSG